MAMFDTFAMDAPIARQPYHTVPHIPRRSANHTISDLVDQFTQHTLKTQSLSSPVSLSSLRTPTPIHTRLATTRSAPPSRSPSPPSHAAYRRMSASALRAQRQANIRLLSDTSHLQELHALVERMVDDRDQCRVCADTTTSAPCSPTSSTSSVRSAFSAAESPRMEDEGFGDEMDQDETGRAEDDSLNYRRSGELGVPATVPCVRKDIKVRKRRQRNAGAR